MILKKAVLHRYGIEHSILFYHAYSIQIGRGSSEYQCSKAGQIVYVLAMEIRPQELKECELRGEL